ncbi:monovalent cation:proton antiporter-2 (CPA2) family protein [Acuticoccus sp. M5D2P5]|uniref:monovalent cation:proton antiporter-2 (CPA2) family protein n=1 Tax=Acuticoccus kalidii TaxID=2910977 RepID=UPI001F302174|nr:monovalent cation:proton antiporter-2 (CPA2) family protein [Acuticoccus kalidii]MCF3932131.1 monovalent cation:proton antiporter-2 (CPA2) family protein [Acuticoccus kalidii]
MQDDPTSAFLIAIAVLAAAVIFVPLFKRLGLGPVLGYLCAGVILGPGILGIVEEPDEVMQFAELGIAFLLFLIGLELEPRRLWSMRRDIFGLGALQVVACALVIMLFPLIVQGTHWQVALVAGLGLALSSTAIVMQIIEERGAMRLPYGQKTFAVLLMQDIAIVPLLVVVRLVSPGGEIEGIEAAQSIAVALLAIGGIVIGGRYLLTPYFRTLARYGGTEIMTAGTLLVVIAAGTAMVAVGLSMAMGAFLAGVLLAESNYRRELEADIEPFRGVLLGLFFLSVGMLIDLSVVADNALLLLFGLAFLLVAKGIVVYFLVRVFGGDHVTSAKSAILLSQGGEFGFVLYTTAATQGVMTQEMASLLIAVVSLSMVTTPFLVRFVAPFLARQRPVAEPEEDFSDAKGEVLVIGFGRFGQVVSQMLLAAGHDLTILDNDVNRVVEARRFGNRVYYGDGGRLDVLRAARADRCRMIAVLTTPAEKTNMIVDLVREQFPHAKLFARSFDRRHSLTLAAHNVDYERRETFDGAIRFGRDALVALGMEATDAKETEIMVRKWDRERLEMQRIEGLAEGHRKWREVTPRPFVRRAPEDRAPDDVAPDVVMSDDVVAEVDDVEEEVRERLAVEAAARDT